MKLQQSLGLYANHQLATPDLHVANRATGFVPRIVGEDGQEMTMARRQELMKGKPTMADLAATGVDPMDVGQYTTLFDKDIELEEMGASAIANRRGFQRVVTQELELPNELLARQGLPGEIRDVTLCCYSAPYVRDAQTFWSELGVAILKIRALGPLDLAPEQVLMSQAAHALVGAWYKQMHPVQSLWSGVGDLLMNMPVYQVDRLTNELRVCATSSRPELSGRYASLFIDQTIFDALNIDLGEETVVMPIVKPQ